MDGLNLEEGKIIKCPLGGYQFHAKFREKVDIVSDESVRNSFQIAFIKNIRVQLYPMGFQILHLKDDEMQHLGEIIMNLSGKPSLFQRILEELDEAERILGFRK